MRILVTGGAGFIGSHIVKALSDLGHEVTILDNLSTGHTEAVKSGELFVGDLQDDKLLEDLFLTKKFEAVFHLAGSIKVPESVLNPLKYYQNNTFNSFKIISMCLKHNCLKFIFSSSAAVYGVPENGIAREDSPLAPINPYGTSKLMTENMLRDVSLTSDFSYVALRYFNVSGADSNGEIGQSFPDPFHLIDLACECAVGMREKIEIYGTNYLTADGTCVRDYVHVSDLADAHVRSLDYLCQGGASTALNCGYGHGYSVREVIQKVIEVTGKNFTVVESSKRNGDPPILTAEAEKIKSLLKWNPRYDNLKTIIKSTYLWKLNRTY